MSETVNKDWLEDIDGNKFAPRTLTTAVQDADGKLLEEYLDSMVFVGNDGESTEFPDFGPNISEEDALTIKSQLGLDNVDNTSDADKPVSIAQQKAIDAAQIIIITKDELEAWLVGSGAGSDILRSTVYGNDMFVAVGDGSVYYSTDGITWNTGNRNKNVPLSSVTYGNNMFVAVGEGGYTYYSTDGINWQEGSGAGFTGLFGVTYGDNIFVAVALYGDTYYSTDGINWQEGSGAGSSHLTSVTYGNNMFVTVGDGAYYSTDGINWQEGSGAGTSIHGVTYGNNMFVATAYDGNTYYSTDGINWQEGSGAGSYTLCGVTYGNNMFVAVGGAGATYYSTDGITWTGGEVSFSGTSTVINGVTYGNGMFVAVANYGETYYFNCIVEQKNIKDAIVDLTEIENEIATLNSNLTEIIDKYLCNWHDSSEDAPTNLKLIEDCNTPTYFIGRWNANSINSPYTEISGATGGIIISYIRNANNTTTPYLHSRQIGFGHTENAIYTRYCNADGWSEWIDVQAQIDTINSNLNSRKTLLNDTSKIPENAFLSNYQGMTTFGSTNGFVDVATLLNYIIPEGYRPNFPARFPCYYSDTEGKPYLGAIYVDKTGSISIRYAQYYGTSAAAPTTGTVYFNASWISQ